MTEVTIDASSTLGEGVTVTVDTDSAFGARLASALQSVEADQERGEGDNVAGIAADRLRSIVERVERLDAERKAIGADIKDIFVEAKSAGFDVKVIRTILKIRRMEPAEVEEQETLLDLYRRALGM